MRHELVCIACPVGCRLAVDTGGGEIVVTGHACGRGARYGQEEVVRPARMVTSSVTLDGGAEPLVSVRTALPVPKNKVRDVLEAIRGMRVAAPAAVGQMLSEDIAGTGIPLIVTRGG